MKKLTNCFILLCIMLTANVYAQPKYKNPPPKKEQKKTFEPRFINPLQEVNLDGYVITKGHGSRKQVFLEDMDGNIYTLSIDDAHSRLYYEDLFAYDGFLVQLVGTLDTRTSVIEVKIIRVKQTLQKRKDVKPPKKEVEPPKKETKPPKKEVQPPKKDNQPPKKQKEPLPPKK